MAKRKGKMMKRRRQPKKGVNLVNAAQAGIILNAMTQGLFNSNLVDFFTGMRDGQFKAGVDGTYRLTLPELLGFTPTGFKASAIGGQYAQGYGFTRVVGDNLRRSAMPIILTTVLTPVAFKVGKQLTAMPRRDVNKALKALGLKSVVSV